MVVSSDLAIEPKRFSQYVPIPGVALLPLDDVIKELLKLSIEFDNNPSNTKYCIQNMLRELQETPRGKKFLECQTLEEIW